MSIYLTPLDCGPDSHLKTILGLSPAIFVHCSAKTPLTPSADWRLLIQGHPSIHLFRQAATKQWHKDMNIASRRSEDTFCDGCISNEAPPSGIHNETHWFSTNPQITAQKQAILLQKTRRSFWSNDYAEGRNCTGQVFSWHATEINLKFDQNMFPAIFAFTTSCNNCF